MRAEFQLAGDLKVAVFSDPLNGGVIFEVRRGYDSGLESGPKPVPVTVEQTAFSKHHARAIASAMMGCAAEA